MLAGLTARLAARDRRNLWILALCSLLAYMPAMWAALNGSWPFDDDAPALIGPWREFARESLRAGVLPLWNSHLFCGLPFMANGQTAVLYPPNIVYWLLPVHPALWLDALAHNILFACGGYVLAREMKLSRTGSMLAALCFALGGSISAHIFTGHMTWHAARAWLPWQLWALLRYGRSGQTSYIILLSLFFALQVGAGYPPLVLMGAALCLGLFVARGVARWFSARGPQKRDQSTLAAVWPRNWWLHACGLAILAALLSAVWILPLRETSAFSVHGSGLPYGEATHLSGSWKSLMRLLLPNVFNGNRYMQWSLIYGSHEEAAYIGMLPVLLAFLAPLLVRRGRHPALVWLWLAMWPCLLLTMGDNTPLYRWLFETFAPFRLLRNPVRWLEVWFFLAALLAACAFDQIFKLPRQSTLQDTSAPVATAATPDSALSSSLVLLRRACAAIAALCAMLALWLWLVPPGHEWWLQLVKNHPRGRNAENAAAVARVFWNAVLAQTLSTLCIALALLWVFRISSRARPGRIAVWLVAVTGIELLALFWSCAKAPSTAQTRNWIAWPSQITSLYQPPQRWDTGMDWRALNQALPLHIDLFNGYDAMNTAAYFEFVRALEGKELWADMYQPVRRTPLLRVAGVSHSLISIRALDTLRQARATDDERWNARLVAQFGKWNLWRHDGAWPRVYGARRLLRAPVPGHLALLERVSREARFSATAVVEPAAFPAVPQPPGAVTVLAATHETNRVTMQTQAAQRGVVVLSDAWFPGWRASVNGREVPIEHANHLFRAVEVPRGKAAVTFFYAPQSFRIGAFLSLCALAFVAAFATARGGVRRR
ncbi:MAG: hypothetical protein JWN98_408 [Abditibacteriota bacterium]|nr:hypothetical protein [Abditibacteriota bacterium]